MHSFRRPKTISEEVYDYLREELFAGRIEAGSWLREQEVAEALHVSRTPVREAIRRLTVEGFMVVSASRGAQVRSLTLAEAVDVYEVRYRLEGMAARLAAEHANEADVAGLREQLALMEELDEEDFVGQIRADNEFHLSLATLSGNEVLCDLVQQLNDRVTRAKVVTRDVNTSVSARSQHELIVDAIAAGDGAEAEEAMRHHISMNLEIIRSRLSDSNDVSRSNEAGAVARPVVERTAG